MHLSPLRSCKVIQNMCCNTTSPINSISLDTIQQLMCIVIWFCCYTQIHKKSKKQNFTDNTSWKQNIYGRLYKKERKSIVNLYRKIMILRFLFRFYFLNHLVWKLRIILAYMKVKSVQRIYDYKFDRGHPIYLIITAPNH